LSAARSILISGATGFIGSHLARTLVQSGENVHIITREKTDLSVLEPIIGKLHVHLHDGTTEGMISIVEKSQPDLVFHLATCFLSSHTPKDISNLVQSNVLFGTQLLEALDVNSVHRLVNAGTTWQHYQDVDYSPVNLYSATKQAFEDVMQYYCSVRSLNAITVELTDTYGPQDQRKKLFYLLGRTANDGSELAMSPGGQVMDLLYIDDAVRAFLSAKDLLLENKLCGYQKYQALASERLTLKEIVVIYEKVSGKKLNIQWGGRPYREREILNPWCLGEKLPGWEQQVFLEQGLGQMLNENSEN
jgi:nucleoside-diphosphate-sugar epimerase